MKRWIFVLMAFAMAAGSFGPASRADELSVSVAGDTKFLVQLDIQAFRETALGGKLFEIAKNKAKLELSEGSGDGKGADLEKIHEMIGFDPFQEIEAILVSGSHYDRPEQSVVVSIRMRKTTGNLEGLILGLPEYAAQDYGKYTIHSASPDKDHRVFGSVHTDGKGNKTVLLATQRDAVTHRLDSLDGKPTVDSSFKTVKLATEGKQILALEVLDIPTDLIGDGPQSGVAKILRAVSLRIGESKGNVTIGIWLTAGTEQQAEQLRQMAQGLTAMIGFLQSADPKDEDLKVFQKFVQNITATRDGLTLKVSLGVSAEELNKIIDEQLGDH